MLKAGFIRHTVSKSSFSEQCYYAFGDLALAPAPAPHPEGAADTLAPLPAPLVAGAGAWAQYPAFAPPAPSYGALGPIYNPAPPPSAYMGFQGARPNQSPR